MLRRLLPILCALLIAAPAMGYTTIWEGAAEGDIQIDLQVDCYIQIQWQDTQIQFDGTSDFWANQLMGVGYAACPDPDGKFAADPWAGDDWYAPNGIYFESGDGAVIFVHSNNDLSMWTHTNGNLAGTINDPANQIPTWFTVALAPFKIGGVPIVTGTIPGDGQGCYLFDGGFPVFGYDNAAYNYPNQYAFACAPASQTWHLGPMAPEVEGTIKYLCRILRHGMADPGDHYHTLLDVTFTTP